MSSSMYDIFSTSILIIFLILIIISFNLLVQMIRRSIFKRKTSASYKKLLIIAGVLFIIFAVGMFNISYNLEIQPRDIKINEAISPNKLYKIVLYDQNTSFLADTYTIGELINTQTSKKRTIYFNKNVSNTTIEWLSDSVVLISGHKINIEKNDIFDFRKNRQ